MRLLVCIRIRARGFDAGTSARGFGEIFHAALQRTPTKTRSAAENAASRLTRSLKPELRSEGHSQIVMSSVIEVDIVAHLRTNTKWSRECLKPSPRIHREERRSVGQAYRVDEARGRILVVDAEIVETNLARDEDAEGPGAGLELRSEKTMQRAELRIHQLRGHAIGEGSSEAALKIVRHLRFQLDAGMEVKRRPASNADEIAVRRRIAG